MIVVEKLKLNKFKQVTIPRNKDLFMRVGSRPVTDIQDGQVAHFTNGTMEELSVIESQVLKDNQMTLDEH